MAKKFDVKALREKVINSDDIQYESLYVKEWDVELPVKTLSTSEMKKVMEAQDDNVRMMILAVLHGCKTEDGEAVFTGKDLAKFESEKAFGPVTKVATKILELSGFNETAVEEAKND